MTQAQTVQPCGDDPTTPAPDPAHSNAAGWVLAVVLVAVAVYEIWAVKSKRPTISQWMKRTFGKHRWWRPFGIAVIGLTLWHLFFGGPI